VVTPTAPVTRYLLPVLFHLTPLVPLFWGRYYGALAMLLGVALPYIKVAKLRTYAALLEGADEPLSGKAQEELRLLRLSIARWRALTFLSVVPAAPASQAAAPAVPAHKD
jgi:hypothetical protein